MKRMLSVVVLILAFSVVNAQHEGHNHSVAVSNPGPEVLKFKVTEYDFGKIPQGKPVYYYFEIVNTSNAPIKLESVQATCGCTTPEWNQAPIPPGGTDKIKVGYNAATEGYFDKPITITYNGTQTKQIKIKGTVWKAPPASAPANQSVQFLNQQIQ